LQHGFGRVIPNLSLIRGKNDTNGNAMIEIWTVQQAKQELSQQLTLPYSR
jgi:hypothetical protein